MRERELKFTPAPSFQLPPLTDLEHGVRAAPPEELRLQAFYFDTEDLRLSRAGASLRYRSDDGWTVKLPVSDGDLLTRDEISVPGEPGSPPAEALDLVRATIRSAPVQLAARLTTLRRKTKLYDQAGGAVGEVVDDEVSVLDGMRLAARFRELEVELGADAPKGFAEAITAALRVAGAGKPTPTPKIVRALGPRAMQPADVECDIEPDDAIGLVRRSIADALARLVAHDPGVRIGEDPEAVHQARVATRRLRSDLRTFKPLVDKDWAKSLRDELKWLGERLGAVRDGDVMSQRLADRLESLPDRDRAAGERILAHRAETRDAARAELLDALRSDRYVALLDRLVDTIHAPTIPAAHSEPDDGDHDTHTDFRTADLVRRPWKHLRDAVEALDDDPPDEELHEVRILAKRARYAAEAVAPVNGKPARRLARALARVQDVLGEHQDAVVAQQWLHDVAAELDGDADAAFVAGELAGGERDAAERSRAAWPRQWQKARRPKLRRWL